MSRFEPYRAGSRTNWGRHLEDNQQLSREDLQLGCLLRIADATELMAKRHAELQQSLDYYKSIAAERADEITYLKNQLRGARGSITRLRKRIAATTVNE